MTQILLLFLPLVFGASVAPAREENKENILPEPGKCGVDTSDRIYGGSEADIDEFPWMTINKYSKRK